MKNYDEIAKNVLERRDAHNAVVAKRKKIILRAGVPVLTLCLAVMIGVGHNEYSKISNSPEIVEDAIVPGIDDTVDPGETGAYEHLTETYVDPPVPGGAEVGTAVTTTAVAIATEVQGKNEPEVEIGAESPEVEDEIWIEPKWAEKTLYSKYPEFELNGKKYTTGAAWIAENKRGEVIGSTTAYGYDVYDEKSYEIGIKVYEITGIDKNVAVAVGYDGFDGQYAVYYDMWYTPATLGEFITALNLYENLSFGNIYYASFEADFGNEGYMTAEYNIADVSVIFDLLRDNELSVNVADSVSDFDMSFYEKSMSVSVNVDILGIRNVSLIVTENGYISTNILGTRKLFFIGEDKAEEFFEYVHANSLIINEETLVATTTAVLEQSPSDIEEVATAVTQISPAYNPNDVVNE